MANGLSKLIKRARKANESNILAKLAQRNRFRVEELEDRIAPAFVAASYDGDAGDDAIVAWSSTGDAADWADASSGIAFMGGTLDVAFTPSATSMGNLTITNGTGVGASETLYIASNASIGTLDFSSLSATTTTLTIVINAGVDFAAGGGTGWTEAELDGTGGQDHGDFAGTAADAGAWVITAAADDTDFTNFAATGPTDAADPDAIGTGIGAITVPSTVTTLNINVYGGDAATEGTIGAISATGATIATGSTALGATIASLSASATAGTVTTGAISGALTVTNNVATFNAASIGSVNIDGDVTTQLTSTTAGIGTVAIDGDVATLQSASTIGNVTIGGDVSATITAATNIGDVTVTGSLADVTATAGTIGDIEADTIVDVTSDGTIDSITTTGTVGAGTIATITTGDNNIGSVTTSDGAAGTTTANITGAVNLGTGNVTGAWNIDGSVASTFAGGDINAVVTATSFANTIAVNTIGSAGGFTASTGNFANTITIADGLDGDLIATAGNFGAIITLTDGDISSTGSVVATAGSINALTLTSGDLAGAVSSGTTIGAVILTDGDIAATGSIAAGSNLTSLALVSGDILAGGTVTSVGTMGTIGLTDGDIAGTITAGSTLGVVTITAGDLSGDITSGTTMAAVNMADGDITATGSLTAGSTMALVTLTSGDILAGATLTSGDTMTGVDIVDGNMAGTITSVTAITSISVADTTNANETTDTGNVTGTISAGTTIGTVTIEDTLSSAITAGTGFTGAITIGDAANEASGGITSTGSIIATTGNFAGAIDIQDGGMAGTLRAVAGEFSALISVTDDVDDADGIISGTIRAGADINAITASDGITGTVSAGDDIDGAITVTSGDMSGTITANDNITAAITITDGDFTGTVTVTGDATDGDGEAGDFAGMVISDGNLGVSGDATKGVLTINEDLTGPITVVGNIYSAITVADDVEAAGDISAVTISGAITVAGDLAGDVLATTGTANTGSIASITAGSIANATAISGDDGIGPIVVTGNIGTAVITADAEAISDGVGDITSITAGGSIGAAITGQNIGLIQSGGDASDDITGIVTASKDLDGVDAGNADVTAAITANQAQSDSPLFWVIDAGVCYSIWAMQTGDAAVDTAVTAKVVYTPGVPNAIAITELATTSGIFNLYVKTTADNGAAVPDFDTDTDLDIVQAGSPTVTINADTAITIGTLSVEGTYAVGGDEDITATTTSVEGGVSGTISVVDGTDYIFNSLAGNLTVNVASGTAGTLEFTNGTAGVATMTINGSVDGLYFGDASQGAAAGAGNLGGALTITATGSVGDVVIDGTAAVGLTWSATSFGDIIVEDGGAFGNNTGTITATTGSIGNINVDGDINLAKVEAATTIGIITGEDIGAAANMAIVAGGEIGGIIADGSLGAATTLSITSQTGGIGSIIANGATAGVAMLLNVDVDGDIDEVIATEDAGGTITGDIRSISGDIGTVSSVDSLISANITAVAGDIEAVTVLDGVDANFVASANVTGTVRAGGDINTVAAGGVAGTYIAGAATAASPITVWTFGTDVYTLEATGDVTGATFAYAFTASAIDLSINNSGNTAAAPVINLALTTSDNGLAVDEMDESLSAAVFSLASLDFIGGADDLGSVTVEGSVTGPVVAGTLGSLLVEGDISVPVVLSNSSTAAPVYAVAMATAAGSDDPTAIEMADMIIGAVFAAPAVGTPYTVPVSGTVGDVSFAVGATDTTLGTPVVLSLGNDNTYGVGSFGVTVAADGLDVEASRWADGAITIIGDLDYVIYGTDIDAVTITGSILDGAGIDAYNIDAITIGAAGDYTTGNLAGFIMSSIPDDTTVTAGIDGDIGAIVINGNIESTGLIYAENDIASLTVGQIDYDFGAIDNVVGNIAGEVIVLGNMTGNITAENTLGGLFMIGGDSGNFLSNNDEVTADIFIGGTNGADTVSITGNAITGDLVIGAIGGIDTLTLVVRDLTLDADIETYTIDVTAGAGILVEIAAGNVSSTALTVDAITLIGGSTALDVTSANSDNSIDVTEIFALASTTLALDVEGSVGTIVGGDGLATFQSSSTLADSFSTNYDMFMYDAETPLDAADADDTDVNTIITFNANVESVVGVIATGAASVTAAAVDGDFGYTVALDGIATMAVTTADNIGHIFGAAGVAGTATAVNSIGVGDTTALAADLVTYGLTLPVAFNGGVMAATGNQAAALTANGYGLPYSTSGYAMGQVTAITGSLTGAVTVLNGDFGGIVVPNGDVDSAIIASEDIDWIVVPNYDNADGTFSVSAVVAAVPLDNAGIFANTIALVNGETVVSDGESFEDGFLSVSTGDAGLIAWVDGAAGGVIANVYIIGGIAAGSTLTIKGDVTTLTCDGTWAGTVDMIGENDDVRYEIDTVVVNGNIDATTADLKVLNFDDIEIENGFGVINDIAGVSDGFDVGGALNSTTVSTTFINPSDDTQTVALSAGKNVQMDYDMYFGKMTDVTLTGRGGVSIVSTDSAVQTAKDVKAIVRDTAKGGLPASEGTAVMGEITVQGFDKVKINGLVVDGELDELNSGTMDVKNLYVNGDAEELNIGDSINGAFIKGDLTDLVAENAKNLTVIGSTTSVTLQSKADSVFLNGGVGTFQAVNANNVFIDGNVTDFHAARTNKVVIDGNVADFGAMHVKNTTVDGTVANLDIQERGSIINSVFSDVGVGNVDGTKKIMYALSANGSHDGVGGTTTVGDMVLKIRTVNNPYYVKVVNSALDDGAWSNTNPVVYLDS